MPIEPESGAIVGAVVRESGTGPITWAMGGLFEQLVSGAETGDALGVSRVTLPVGAATPLHRHSREAEAFYVLSGSMVYRAGEERFDVGEGGFVFLPKGMPHAFRVTGRDPVVFLGLTVPGHLLHLYDEVGIPATERRLPGADGQAMEEEIAKWLELGPRYGLEVVGPPIPE